jgi:acetyl-CoA carboxylase biotin carboxyl carrier protein
MPIRRRRRHDTPDVAELARQLGAVLDELRLTEAEVRWGDVTVRVQRAVPVAAASAPAGLPDPVVLVERPGNMVTMEAPMVGTFYRASAPTAEPYVREGDVVKEGQIVCIIEAMKLMNEIEVKTAGRIAKILVDNGQAVEYGQPLFLIEPSR